MKVQITKPCEEDWYKMKIGLISNHCEKCEKSVIDFTKMNRAEIITYILSNPQGDVCGRMNRDQFDFHHEDIPILIEALKKKSGNTSFLILSLVCLSLVACKEDNSSQQHIKTSSPIHTRGNTMGKMQINDQIQTNKKNSSSTKETKTAKQVVSKPPKTEEILTTPGISPYKEIPLMGLPVVVDENNINIQQREYNTQEEEILTFAEKMPEYNGGVTELFAFINSNIKYPESAREYGIQGTVYVQFVVNKNGEVLAPKILRGIEGHPEFDKEELRIIKIMPNWIAGENKGKKVSVYSTIPVKFKLQ